MGLSSFKYYGDDTGFENYNIINKKTLNMLDAIKNSNKFYTIELHEGSITHDPLGSELVGKL